MKKNNLLFTTALFSVAMIGGIYEAQADIVKTKITTYVYEFPDSKPKVDTETVTVANCSVGGGDDHDSGGHDSTGGSYGDSDGDGYSDAGGYTPDPPGTDDGYGDNGTTQSSPGMNSGCDGCSAESGSSGGSSSGGGTVMCTHFYQKGELDEILYFADIESSKTMFSPITVRGYHTWGVPFVRHMRAHPGGKLERAMRFVVIHRNREIAYQMGLTDTPDVMGKVLRVLLEPACHVIGHFVPETDWRDLYNKQDFKAFAEGYRRYKAYKYMRDHRAEAGLTQIIHKLAPPVPVATAYLALRAIQ